MISGDVDNQLYETASALAGMPGTGDMPWSKVKKLILASKVDLSGCEDNELQRRFNRYRGAPPSPPDTASINLPSHYDGRRFSAPENSQINESFIRIVSTNRDSPTIVLDDDMCMLTHQEPKDGDQGYYITDQICEIFCGPARIGEEVELTFQYIDEEEPRTRKFIVKRHADLDANVVCPRENLEVHLVAEDAHSSVSRAVLTPLPGLPFWTPDEKKLYEETAADEQFQEFVSTTMAKAYASPERLSSDPFSDVAFLLRLWRMWINLPRKGPPKIHLSSG